MKKQPTKIDNHQILDSDISRQLKYKVSETEVNFANAGPAEILHRSCKMFKYEAKFLDQKNGHDDYVCELKVKSGELQKYSLKTWVGKGRSKDMAKSNAMLSLLNTIKA